MFQLKDPWLAIGINAALFDKHLVATRAALAEFTKGNLPKAGPAEKALAAIVLRRVDPIANDPSERVRRLHAGGKKASEDLDNIVDRIVFGTGDKRGIPTVSGDRKFPPPRGQPGRRAASLAAPTGAVRREMSPPQPVRVPRRTLVSECSGCRRTSP